MLCCFCGYIASSLMPQGPFQRSITVWTIKRNIPNFTSVACCAGSIRQFEFVSHSSVFGNISLSLVLYTYNWINVCSLAEEVFTIPNSSALITSLIFIFQSALAHFSICLCDTYTCKMKNHKNPFGRLLEEILTTTNLL